MTAPNQVVQAQCPGCKNTLKIPANWINEPMKCKHCGLVFQAKPPKPRKPLIRGAIQSLTTLHIERKKARKERKAKKAALKAAKLAALQSKPHAPPPVPGVPMAQPAVPVATPAAGPGGVPVARAVAAPSAIPVAAPVAAFAPPAMGIASGQKPASFPRRRRGGWQKIAFLLIFFVGLGSLGAILYHTNPDLFNLDSLHAQADSGKDPASTPAAHPDTKAGEFIIKTPTTTAREVKSSKKEGPLFVVGTTPKVERTYKERPKPTGPGPRDTGLVRPNTGKKPPDKEPTDPDPIRPVEPLVKGFPRRMLAIGIGNYPYANPVAFGATAGGAGASAKAFHNLVRDLGVVLKVPDDQITIVSDKSPSLPSLKLEPFPPTKSLMEATIAQFLDTSRPMDRVVLLFVGHAVEMEGKPYLVPLLGEASDEKTLLPLDWIYARLASCPAQEKVLILDVCRFDPTRGEERGKVDPMGDAFDAMLQTPPRGVEVLTSCSAGQYSYEMEKDKIDTPIEGGVFLNGITEIKKTGLRGIIQKPEDPLPIASLYSRLKTWTTPKVKAYLKKEQTPQLYGTVQERTVTFDSKAPTPARLMVKLDLSEFPGGIASKADIDNLLKLPNRIPPLKLSDKGNTLKFEALPPYPKAKLDPYKVDGKDSDLRAALNEAIDLLIKHNNAFQELFPAVPANPQQKGQYINQIQNQQQSLAEVYAALESKYEELKALKPDRDKETKGWQAAYDYVQARLLFRMTQFFEYQVMLGKIRKDELPPLDKDANQTGYRLASKATLSDPGAVKLQGDAKKLLTKIAEEHKGTPWELIAKRESATALGLEWKAR